MSVFDFDIDELCAFVKNDNVLSDEKVLIYIEKYIPKIFQIFASKNKKHHYNDAYEFCKKIIDFVNKNVFGQVFITDTHKERSEEILTKAAINYSIFKIENGKLNNEKAK